MKTTGTDHRANEQLLISVLKDHRENQDVCMALGLHALAHLSDAMSHDDFAAFLAGAMDSISEHSGQQTGEATQGTGPQSNGQTGQQISAPGGAPAVMQ